MIAEIDVYLTHAQQVEKSEYLGNTRRSQTLEKRALPSFSFNLEPKQSKALYIRSQSQGGANLPLVLYHQRDFDVFKLYLYLLWGGFIGLIFIMSLYNLILYNGVKDNVYLFYVGYVLAILMEMGLLHGFIVYLVPPIVVDLLTSHLTTVHYVIVFFALMFALKYLKFDQDPGPEYKIGISFSGLLVPFAISAIWMKEYESVQIFFVVQGIAYLFAFYLLAKKFRENFSWAKYYFISWMPIFLGGVITPLLIVGKIEYSFWIRNALLMGVMAEASLMAMALANRLKSNEDQVIFSLTHDHHFGLPNSSLMAKRIKEEQLNYKSEYRYITIVGEIQQYHIFSAYFDDKCLKGMLKDTCTLIESKLSSLPLLYMGRNPMGLKHTFLLKGGIMGYVIGGTDVFRVESILDGLSKAFPISYQSESVTLTLQCHFGISRSIDDIFPEQVANKALQAINTAKHRSKFYSLYSAEMANKAQRKIALVADLQSALDQDELELYHQPQVTLAENRVRSSEVLIRWNHPQYGFIPPDEFIRIAEDTGMIEQLTRWVIAKAYAQLNKIRNTGLQQKISINVSVLDIVNDKLCEFIISQCAEVGLSPRDIIIEVTETEGIQDQEKFTQNLLNIESAGFNIAIDDYGTGYSSLYYLSSYPIHEIKIDRSLINNLVNSKRDQLIVNATLSMAKSLNLEVVIEGVEDQQTLDYLKTTPSDIIQGYYYSKPLPLTDYLNWMKLIEGNE